MPIVDGALSSVQHLAAGYSVLCIKACRIVFEMDGVLGLQHAQDFRAGPTKTPCGSAD